MQIVEKSLEKRRLKKGEKRQVDWAELVNDIIDNCDLYHQSFYKKRNFTGPSLHFHRRALFASEIEKPEMVYALLVSWGMHRMGERGAKMKDFEVFENSISVVKTEIESLNRFKISDFSEPEFSKLKHIFNTLDPMESRRKIVAVSKVLAHLLPNLVAPIDNEYTFRFVFGAAVFPRNWEDEFELFKEIHLKLFKKIFENKVFRLSAKLWLKNPDYLWDTSMLKIIDNLIIGKISSLRKLG